MIQMSKLLMTDTFYYLMHIPTTHGTAATQSSTAQSAVLTAYLSPRYTLIPTSFILGLGGAPLWSAKCTYLTISGNAQAAKEGRKGSDVINQYFGVFFFLFQSSAVWGNLMSSLIFGQDTSIGRKTPEPDTAEGQQSQLSKSMNPTHLVSD